jgi:hypothetical protein
MRTEQRPIASTERTQNSFSGPLSYLRRMRWLGTVTVRNHVLLRFLWAMPDQASHATSS